MDLWGDLSQVLSSARKEFAQSRRSAHRGMSAKKLDPGPEGGGTLCFGAAAHVGNRMFLAGEACELLRQAGLSNAGALLAPVVDAFKGLHPAYRSVSAGYWRCRTLSANRSRALRTWVRPSMNSRTNFGLLPGVSPSRSCSTRTWPSVCWPAPMPMVTMSSARVIFVLLPLIWVAQHFLGMKGIFSAVLAANLIVAKAADEPCLMSQRSNCNARRGGGSAGCSPVVFGKEFATAARQCRYSEQIIKTRHAYTDDFRHGISLSLAGNQMWIIDHLLFHFVNFLTKQR